MYAREPPKEISKNGCHFKNTGHIDLIIHVHILGAYVHMCARYEVSVIKPVARGLSTDDTNTNNDNTGRQHRMPHDGQFMISYAHRHKCQMSQKDTIYHYTSLFSTRLRH